MAITVTLTTLRSRVRERADMVGSSFIADAATGLDAWINEANQKLHGMLVDAMGEEYVLDLEVSPPSAGPLTTRSRWVLQTLRRGPELPGAWRSLLRYERSERNAYREMRPDLLPGTPSWAATFGCIPPT